MGLRREGGRGAQRETPQQAWERMRGAGARPPEPPASNDGPPEPPSTLVPQRERAREAASRFSDAPGEPNPFEPAAEAATEAAQQPPASNGEPARPALPPTGAVETYDYPPPAAPQPAAPPPPAAPQAAAPPPAITSQPAIPPTAAAPRSVPPQGERSEPSVADLMKDLSEQTSTLVRKEMQLAQAELKEKGKKVGIGAGLFGVGGLAAFLGGAVLIVGAVLALSTALDAWLAALIVGVVLLAAAGIAAVMGKKQIEEATPPAPEAAIGSVKRDIETVKERAHA